MFNRIVAAACLAVVAIWGLDGRAAAEEPTGVFVFGDSLSDPGNLFAITGGTIPPSPPYFAGRFSNGPVWAELFPAEIGLAFNPLTNFAFGGAETGSAAPTDVLNQVGGFLMSGAPVDPGALHLIWAGSNDYINNLLTAPDPAVLILGTVTNLGTSVFLLSGAGAKRFVLINLPNLGDTPGGQASGAAVVAALNTVTGLHNAALEATAAGLRSSLGVEITTVDINAVFAEILADPGTFGFVNTAIPCITPLGPTGACPTLEAADVTLFFDPIHPTRTAHRVIAQFVNGTLTTTLKGPRTIATQSQLIFRVVEAQNRAVAARLYAVRSSAGGINLMGNQFAAMGGATPLSAAVFGTAGPNEGATSGQPDADRRARKPLSAYLSVDYAIGERDPTSSQSGFDYDVRLLSGGLDYRVDDNLLIGASLGFGLGEADLDAAAGKVESESFVLTGYGSFAKAGWYVDASAGFSVDNFDEIERATGFAPLPKATADTDGDTRFLTLNGGFNLTTGPLSVGPTLGIRYAETEIEGYKEEGAGPLNLTVEDQEAESLIGSVGAQATLRFESDVGVIAPHLRVSFEREFDNEDRSILARLPGGQLASVTAEADDEDVVVVGGGVAVQFSGTFSAVIDYEASIGRDDGEDHSIHGRLRIAF